MEELDVNSNDPDSFLEKLQNIDWGETFDENKISILLVLFGVAISGTGMFYMKAKSDMSSDELVILDSVSEDQAVQDEIYVEISGAVKRPGVYTFKNGDRVEDVLVKADGLSDDADLKWFEKMINRAAKLTDGQKIYIPRVGEHSLDASANISEGSEGVMGAQTDGYVKMVNINSASQKELESLWGIGPVYAQNIIEQRPYSTVKELVERKIIKQNVYVRNKGLMTVY